jgi:hypothetical protein
MFEPSSSIFKVSSSCCYILACNVVPFFSVSICCPNSIILGWGIMGCNLYPGPQLMPLLTQEILCVVPFLLQTQLTEFRSFEGQEMSTEERVQTIRVCSLYNWDKAFRCHATFFCCLLHDSPVCHQMWWKILEMLVWAYFPVVWLGWIFTVGPPSK